MLQLDSMLLGNYLGLRCGCYVALQLMKDLSVVVGRPPEIRDLMGCKRC